MKSEIITNGPHSTQYGHYTRRIFDGLHEAVAFAETNKRPWNSWETARDQATLVKPMRSEYASGPLGRDLYDLVLSTYPSLDYGLHWQRTDGQRGGVWADPGLVASGDDRPIFSRVRSNADDPQPSDGDIWKIVINTDVEVAAGVLPSDNAVIMSTLLEILFQLGPVEVWIQQGWLGHHATPSLHGISLFRLQLPGHLSPDMLAFWLYSPHKDSPFSRRCNHDFRHHGTSTRPEIPCDIYMGSWPSRSQADLAIVQAARGIKDYTHLKKTNPQLYAKLLDHYVGIIIHLLSQCETIKSKLDE